jgi:hypothetical protein
MVTSQKTLTKKVLLGILLAICIVPIYLFYSQRSLSDQSIDKNQRNDLRSGESSGTCGKPPDKKAHSQIPPIQPIITTDSAASPLASPKESPTDSGIEPSKPHQTIHKNSELPTEPPPSGGPPSVPLPLELPPLELLPQEPAPTEPPLSIKDSSLTNPIVSTLPLADANTSVVSTEVIKSNVGISETVPNIQFLEYTGFLVKFSQGISDLTEEAKNSDPKTSTDFFLSLKELFNKVLKFPTLKENEKLGSLTDLHSQLLKVSSKFEDVDEAFEYFFGTEICKLFKANSYETRFNAFELLKRHFTKFFSKMFTGEINPADYFLEQFAKEVGHGDKGHEISSFWVIMDHDPPKLRNFKSIFSKQREDIYELLNCGLLQNLNLSDEDAIKILNAHDKYTQIESLLDLSNPGPVDFEKLITLLEEYFTLKKECVQDISSTISQFPFHSILSCEKPYSLEEVDLIIHILQLVNFSDPLECKPNIKILLRKRYIHEAFLKLLPSIPQAQLAAYFTAFKNFVEFRLRDPLKKPFSSPCLHLINAQETIEMAKNIPINILMEPSRKKLLEIIQTQEQVKFTADFPQLLSDFKAQNTNYSIEFNHLISFFDRLQEYLQSLEKFYQSKCEIYFTTIEDDKPIYKNPLNIDLFQYDYEYLQDSIKIISQYKAYAKLFLQQPPDDPPEMKEIFIDLGETNFSTKYCCLKFLSLFYSKAPNNDFYVQIANEIISIHSSDIKFSLDALILKLSSPQCPFWEEFSRLSDLYKSYDLLIVTYSLNEVFSLLAKILKMVDRNSEWLTLFESFINTGLKGKI